MVPGKNLRMMRMVDKPHSLMITAMMMMMGMVDKQKSFEI
jgi:hypothetical protein